MTRPILSREGIVRAARSQIGVPFVHQGRTPRTFHPNGTTEREGELDCIGHTLFSLHDEGWRPRNPDSCLRLDYDRLPDGAELGRALREECDEVTLDDALPADILSMVWRGDKYERHIALVSERRPDLEAIRRNLGLYVVHTHPNLKVCEHGLRFEWISRIVTVYRLKDFADATA